MLALFFAAVAWALGRLYVRSSVQYMLAPPHVVVRRPDGSIQTVYLDNWAEEFDLETILSKADLPTSPPPLVIVPPEALDSSIGRKLLGLPEPGREEEPKSSRLTFADIKPWAAGVTSLVLLVMAVWVILRAGFSADDKKSAWAVVSAVLAFWAGAVTS